MFTHPNTFFAAALLVFGAAGPVVADSTEIAVEHFNASADSVGERIAYTGLSEPRVTVSARGNGALQWTISHLNGSADNAGDMRGTNGATVFGRTPAYGADIFEQLRLQDD